MWGKKGFQVEATKSKRGGGDVLWEKSGLLLGRTDCREREERVVGDEAGGQVWVTWKAFVPKE